MLLSYNSALLLWAASWCTQRWLNCLTGIVAETELFVSALQVLCWWKIPFSIFESRQQWGGNVLVSYWGVTHKIANLHRSQVRLVEVTAESSLNWQIWHWSRCRASCCWWQKCGCDDIQLVVTRGAGVSSYSDTLFQIWWCVPESGLRSICCFSSLQ